VIDRLWRLLGWHVPPTAWSIVAVLAVLLILSVAILLIFWPRSRRWSASNRLHELASRNADELRRDTRLQLEGALSTLRVARREAVALGHEYDVTQINRLVHRIETVRDRVASDYSPSPANAPGLRSDLDLERLLASEAVSEQCKALTSLVRDGLELPAAQLEEARVAVREVEDRGVALP
jgi:hypothetical protein